MDDGNVQKSLFEIAADRGWYYQVISVEQYYVSYTFINIIVTSVKR